MVRSLKPHKTPTLVSVITDSESDWQTMNHAIIQLQELDIHCEAGIISAHKTPDRLYSYAKEVETRGIKVIIAGSSQAAHLPSMVASLTNIPILGVPLKSQALLGIDSILSIAQTSAGVPVAAFAIGKIGARNAAIMAASILALFHEDIKANLKAWRQKQTEEVPLSPSI